MAKKKYIISVLAVIFFFGWTAGAFASSISTTSPQLNEIVKLSDVPLNSPVGVYSPCDTIAPYTQQTSFNSDGSDILLDPKVYDFACDGLTGWRTGTYYVFVFTDSSKPCYKGEEEKFSICRAEAAEEFTFGLSIDSGGANLTPDISLLPFDRNVFGNRVEIKYEADDLDDARGNPVYGLGENPVSLYYFEGDSASGRILIAENLPVLRQGSGQAGGSYVWNTGNVPSGNTYRVLAMVKDKILSVDTYASDFFHIDHSVPVFDLKLEPTATKGEDVRVFFEASEELIKLPEVSVVQNSYEPVKVVMKGVSEGAIYRTVAGREVFKKFEGVYKVVSGYDGMAEISAAGEDVAGNVGKTIKGNSRFAVGVEPPPRPVIISPLDKDITASDSVDVIGQAREDLEILLSVNGEGEFRVKPDKEGNFSIKSIPLSRTYNRGLNFITVIGRDSFGNTSEAAVVNIKLNLDPAVLVRFPQRDSSLNRIASITIAADDENNDELKFTYEIRPYNLPEAGLLEENWTVLAKEIKERRFKFDTTKFPDGQYILRITADDGFVKNQVISETFYIRNFRPVISFNDGEKTIIGQSKYILSGSVVIPEKVRETAKLVDLEYSLDPVNSEAGLRGTPEVRLLEDGWINVPLEISSSGFEAKFSLALTDLKEKAHNILFRAKDSRWLDGNATKVLIVDFGPPKAPVVLSPLSGTVFSNRGETSIAIEVSPRFDEDPDKAGVQFTVSGTAEPESTILIEVQPQRDLEVEPRKIEVQSRGVTGADGRFSLRGVTLRKAGAGLKGLTSFKVLAVDAAGNKSPETELSVMYNNPPEIKFLNPRANRGFDRREPVKWEVIDPDGDKVTEVKLSYRRQDGKFKYLTRSDLQGASRTDLGRGSTSMTDLDNKFDWDVSGFEQGNYQLKLEATDGTSPVRSLARAKGASPTEFLDRLKHGQETTLRKDLGEATSYGTSTGVKVIDFFIDNTSPRVELEPLAKNVFTKEFTLDMSGRAFDDLAGVEFVEFTIGPIEVQPRDSLGSSTSKLEVELPSRAVGEEVRLQRDPEVGLQEEEPREVWFKTTITRGYLTKEARFKIFHKLKLDDGIYNVKFRAVDGAGNISGEAVQEVIVDTKPPRIGSYIISDPSTSSQPSQGYGGQAGQAGAITLLPEGGKFLIPEGETADFKISLESDTKSANLNLSKSDFKGVPKSDFYGVELIKNNATGLWETAINLNIEKFKDQSTQDCLSARPSTNDLCSGLNMLISAEDRNGNMINDKGIGEIEIIERGKISSGGNLVKDAKITVQVFNEDSQSFVNWQGEAFGRENPVYTDANGGYSLLLPAGEYQLLIKKKGFKNLKISTFNLGRPRYINFDLELKPRRGIKGFIEDLIETYGN